MARNALPVLRSKLIVSNCTVTERLMFNCMLDVFFLQAQRAPGQGMYHSWRSISVPRLQRQAFFLIPCARLQLYRNCV